MAGDEGPPRVLLQPQHSNQPQAAPPSSPGEATAPPRVLLWEPRAPGRDPRLYRPQPSPGPGVLARRPQPRRAQPPTAHAEGSPPEGSRAWQPCSRLRLWVVDGQPGPEPAWPPCPQEGPTSAGLTQHVTLPRPLKTLPCNGAGAYGCGTPSFARPCPAGLCRDGHRSRPPEPTEQRPQLLLSPGQGAQRGAFTPFLLRRRSPTLKPPRGLGDLPGGQQGFTAEVTPRHPDGCFGSSHWKWASLGG